MANIPALQVKSSGTVIAAEQISSLTAAIAGVMVRGSASSSGLPLWFASLLSILRAWRCEQLLNLLEQNRKYILSMHVITQRSPGPDICQMLLHTLNWCFEPYHCTYLECYYTNQRHTLQILD